MTITTRLAAMTATALAMAGCGGSGSDTPAPPTLLPATAYSDHTSNFDALESWGSGLGATPLADVPTSDSAEYRGTATFANNEESFGGNMTVIVDFGANDIDGSIENIIEDDNTPWGGELAIAGSIDRGDAATPLGGSINGTLTQSLRSADVTGSVSGGFVGPGAEGLGLVLDGSWSEPATLTEDFDGVGYAAR